MQMPCLLHQKAHVEHFKIMKPLSTNPLGFTQYFLPHPMNLSSICICHLPILKDNGLDVFTK